MDWSQGVYDAIEFIRYLVFEMCPPEILRCLALVMGTCVICSLPRIFGFTHGGD